MSVAADGVRWRGLLVCAIDGTTMSVPDNAANLAVFTKSGSFNGRSGYPLLRLLALVDCGTRTVIEAVFGPMTSGETTYAARLLASLRSGMILLADRNFAAGGLLRAITGTQMLVRAKTGRGSPKLPVLRRLRDGSYLSVFGGVPVRVMMRRSRSPPRPAASPASTQSDGLTSIGPSRHR